MRIASIRDMEFIVAIIASIIGLWITWMIIKSAVLAALRQHAEEVRNGKPMGYLDRPMN